MFEIKDRLLREVTWNVDKTEEKVPDSESSRLWIFERDDVVYIHFHSFQAMQHFIATFLQVHVSIALTNSHKKFINEQLKVTL